MSVPGWALGKSNNLYFTYCISLIGLYKRFWLARLQSLGLLSFLICKIDSKD